MDSLGETFATEFAEKCSLFFEAPDTGYGADGERRMRY